MPDHFASCVRSGIMRSIHSQDTKPELAVRGLLHRRGFRFRLHRGDLPGRPDIVLAKHRTVVFVHGCFWHSHGCQQGRKPQTNREYWLRKLTRNRERDRRSSDDLRWAGWKVVVVWECETRNIGRLRRRLEKLIGPHGPKI